LIAICCYASYNDEGRNITKSLFLSIFIYNEHVYLSFSPIITKWESREGNSVIQNAELASYID